jgi:nitrogenase molybdenum-cofactor synthesis protein NifE
MYKMLRDARADIMLSGGRSQFVALKAKMPWLDINQERHHAYAGYEGMVELVHEIDKALSNPVWDQVRQPAPWEEVTWEQRADAAIAAEAACDITGVPATRVCQCNTVDRATIEAAIRKHHLTTVVQVTARTGAGGGCGGCGPDLAAILAELSLVSQAA